MATSYASKRNTVLLVKQESTYSDPVLSDAVQVLGDGLELAPTKEPVERNVLTDDIGRQISRTGTKGITATVPCEFKANSTAGMPPEFVELLKAQKFSVTKASTSITTTATGNGIKTLKFSASDAAKLAPGDIIVVKESDGYVITAVESKTDATTVKTISAKKSSSDADVAFSGSVAVSLANCYRAAKGSVNPISITRVLEKNLRQFAVGCVGTGLTIDNMTPGQIPNISFTYEGLYMDEKLLALPGTPSYDDGLPPLSLDVVVLQGGNFLHVSEFTLSVDTTVATLETIGNTSGKLSARQTDRAITGTINPYTNPQSKAQWERFDRNTVFSMFVAISNPGATPNVRQNIAAIYCPSCTIGDLGKGDADDIYTDAITFKAEKAASGVTDDLILGFY